MAQEIFGEVTKSPTLMAKLVEGRMSENIFYNAFSGATLAQLPALYKDNAQLLDKATVGDLYPKLIDGKYDTIQSTAKFGKGTGTDLVGSTMFRLVDRHSATISGKQETVYTLEDVFVQDRETWIPATDGKNILNGAYFKFANPSASEVGEPIVAINFDDQGKTIFCSITSNNIGNAMAIFVGGNLLTAPTIQSKICGGTAQINGNFTTESAKTLSNSLNEGTLPAPLILMQEEKISPTLGDSALS